ncbi:MAG TPA: hypothetical protein VF885_17410 [Arthrobacter sp.]
MSADTVLTPDDFEEMNGEDPADWPERFEPGTFAKVVTHSEGLWTKIIEDNGETIKATMANNPFGDFAAFGDPVEYRRENVRDIQIPESPVSVAPVLAPDDFEEMNGEDPADWPERFTPGTMAKVVSNSEGLWTEIIEDDGETIRATLANQPLGGFAAYGDLVAYRRPNVREIQPAT